MKWPLQHAQENEFSSSLSPNALPHPHTHRVRDMNNVVILFSPGVLSQMQMQVSGPDLVKTSQKLTLACAVSRFSVTNYQMNWFFQPSRKVLEWIRGIWSDGRTYYNPDLKSRLISSRDNSKSQVLLTLSSLRAENRAMYYCARGTVRDFSVSSDTNLPVQYQQSQQGAHSTHGAQDSHRSMCSGMLELSSLLLWFLTLTSPQTSPGTVTPETSVASISHWFSFLEVRYGDICILSMICRIKIKKPKASIRLSTLLHFITCDTL
jgi:immunoglobulin heavy chain